MVIENKSDPIFGGSNTLIKLLGDRIGRILHDGK